MLALFVKIDQGTVDGSHATKPIPRIRLAKQESGGFRALISATLSGNDRVSPPTITVVHRNEKQQSSAFKTLGSQASFLPKPVPFVAIRKLRRSQAPPIKLGLSTHSRPTVASAASKPAIKAA